MTFIIYIGSNKEYINHFQELLQENIVIVKNKEEAGIILKELPSNKIQPLLYEKINPDVDKVNIAYLKKKFKNLYIILVTKKIGKEETSIYIEAGANNTISPDADSDVFKAITNFISKNEILSKKEKKEQNKIDEVFTIPKGKRIFDIIISLSALIALSPFLILIMVLIKLESRGPILYKSKRVGSNFYIFNFWKFRSMYIDAEERLSSYRSMNQYTKESKEKTLEVNTAKADIINDDIVLVSDDYEISEHEYLNKKKEKKDTTFFKIAHDPRVTKMGRFMRKYSIDEIPQLINILKETCQ